MELCEGKYGGKVVRLQRGAHGDLLVIVGVTSGRAPRLSVFMCSIINSGDLFVFDHRGLWVTLSDQWFGVHSWRAPRLSVSTGSAARRR